MASDLETEELQSEQEGPVVIRELERYEMDPLLQTIIDMCGGEYAAAEMIHGCLHRQGDKLASLKMAIPSTGTRENFLNTIVRPGYAFWLIMNKTRSVSDAIGRIDVAANEAGNKLERMAVIRTLTDALGGDNTFLQPFYQAFQKTRKIFMAWATLRSTRSEEQLQACLKDCFTHNEVHYRDLADALTLDLDQAIQVVMLVQSCQSEELQNFIECVPKIEVAPEITSDTPDSETTLPEVGEHPYCFLQIYATFFLY